MEWCYKVIKMIEKDESIMQELKLTKNNIVYETVSTIFDFVLKIFKYEHQFSGA